MRSTKRRTAFVLMLAASAALMADLLLTWIGLPGIAAPIGNLAVMSLTYLLIGAMLFWRESIVRALASGAFVGAVVVILGVLWPTTFGS